MIRRRTTRLLLCSGLLALAAAAAAIDVPALRGRVNDLAGLLSAGERSKLESQLATFENETAHQIVVLTVPTLEGEDIDTFSMRVAESWKIGHEGLDNGAIIIVADKDRRARIEVGYGLEGVVPDAIAARILREQMFTSFRAGRMGEGIINGVGSVMRAARGEEIASDRRPTGRGVPAHRDFLGTILFCGILGGMLGAGLARHSRMVGAGIGALAAFALAFLMLQLVPFAGASSLLGGFLGSMGGGMGTGPSRRGRRVIYSYPSRGWGGGGFGGGGFGGGGFGGGGGGFGGGGASGSW